MAGLVLIGIVGDRDLWGWGHASCDRLSLLWRWLVPHHPRGAGHAHHAQPGRLPDAKSWVGMKKGCARRDAPLFSLLPRPGLSERRCRPTAEPER